MCGAHDQRLVHIDGRHQGKLASPWGHGVVFTRITRKSTILKINYRNTRQMLQTISLIAADLLTADDKEDDGIPLVNPIRRGRDGQASLIIRLPNKYSEAIKIAELLNAPHHEGHDWGDMA